VAVANRISSRATMGMTISLMQTKRIHAKANQLLWISCLDFITLMK